MGGQFIERDRALGEGGNSLLGGLFNNAFDTSRQRIPALFTSVFSSVILMSITFMSYLCFESAVVLVQLIEKLMWHQTCYYLEWGPLVATSRA